MNATRRRDGYAQVSKRKSIEPRADDGVLGGLVGGLFYLISH
jgi:hypothetical protein